MLARILKLPFMVILMGIGAAAMYVPAAHAAAIGDWPVMRAFLLSGSIFLVLTALIGIATANYRPQSQARSHLLALVGTFTLLPLMLAVPVVEALRDTTYLNAWFEMVSSLTTTGATLFDAARLPPSVHLWRAQVGWMGGFFVWVTAVAILAPMNLGGYEVLSPYEAGRGPMQSADEIWSTDGTERLQRYAVRLFPIYTGLTVVLWIGLLMSGNTPLVALCHAMSTLSTSGITPLSDFQSSGSGIAGEALICLFLVFALSRASFAFDQPGAGLRRLTRDPEFDMGLALLIAVPALLFLRHWVGALEVDEVGDIPAASQALWGSIFTVMSFMTTTGFVSTSWSDAQSWSGLATPGLILMGLALVGGGVATTAGGVKLLRVYALYKHGAREMDKLVHPNSVGGAGGTARRLRRQGAYVAWISFMLFGISIAVVTLALSAFGLSFEAATTVAVATLSTTGPVLAVTGDATMTYASLHDGAKLIAAFAMVVGRLETLALIALLNPEFWRR
ncbi:MAG: potassium transporter TrkG [Paracoccaceae bacterium]